MMSWWVLGVLGEVHRLLVVNRAVCEQSKLPSIITHRTMKVIKSYGPMKNQMQHEAMLNHVEGSRSSGRFKLKSHPTGQSIRRFGQYTWGRGQTQPHHTSHIIIGFRAVLQPNGRECQGR